jgi:hypothetical protein
MENTFWRRMLARPWVRAQLCSGIMGSVLLAGGAAYAAHRAQTSAVELGSEILTNVAPLKGAESVSFNGAHFFFANQIINAKLDTVLAGAESICKKEGADLKRDLGGTLANVPVTILPPAIAREADFTSLLTSGKKTEKSGEVACWVRRSQTAQRSILQRVAAFSESFDLSEFGSLQFMHAEAMGADKTLVRMVWSEGKVSLRELFPEDKDTPGHDLPDLPRPVGSFRVVSAHVQGAGHDLVSYQSSQTPEQLDAFYAKQMKTLGWQEVDLGERTEEERQEYSQHAYRRAGRSALLALTPGDQFTDATFIELPQQ